MIRKLTLSELSMVSGGAYNIIYAYAGRYYCVYLLKDETDEIASVKVKAGTTDWKSYAAFRLLVQCWEDDEITDYEVYDTIDKWVGERDFCAKLKSDVDYALLKRTLYK